MKKIIIFIILLYAFISNNYAQKKIRAKGDYIHPSTNFVFPSQLDNFKRVGIYSFDPKRVNIGVVYKNGMTTVSLYIYPADDAWEYRLLFEFSETLQEIAYFTKRGVETNQQAVQYKRDYICNGLNAIIKDKHTFNSLTLYECGKWFFKIRITSDERNSASLLRFEKIIIEYFDPSKLTALNPYKSKSEIRPTSDTFADTVIYGAATDYTLEKNQWALDNVSEKERASGFPSIHLGMHIAALKAFLKYRDEKCPTCVVTVGTQKIIDELQEISDKGYLEVFILDQFNMRLLLDDYTIEKEVWDKYLVWKNKRTSLLSFSDLLYFVVGYVE